VAPLFPKAPVEACRVRRARWCSELDPSRFAEACNAWSARKDTPLADLLVERGWLSAFVRSSTSMHAEPPHGRISRKS
jgi:hypothetical protein